MELFGLDSNPVPEGAVAGTSSQATALTLRYARFPATSGRPLGTVCLFQGRTECIEKYFEVVGDLRRRGFAVATLDWRGQGGSERRLRNRRKGHIDSFEEYDRDLDAFIEQVALPDCPPPYFALAHSTGGLIAAARRARRARPLHAHGAERAAPRARPFAALARVRFPRRRAPHRDRPRRDRVSGAASPRRSTRCRSRTTR